MSPGPSRAWSTCGRFGPKTPLTCGCRLRKNGQMPLRDSQAVSANDRSDKNEGLMNAQRLEPASHLQPEVDCHFNTAALLPQV